MGLVCGVCGLMRGYEVAGVWFDERLVCGLMRGYEVAGVWGVWLWLYEVAYFQFHLVAPRRHTELLSYWSRSNPA